MLKRIALDAVSREDGLMLAELHDMECLSTRRFCFGA